MSLWHRSRCESPKLFVETSKLDKAYKTRKVLKITGTNQEAHEVKRTSSSLSPHRRFTYVGVVRHRLTPDRNHSNWYPLYWPLHLRSISSQTQGHVAAIATGCDFDVQLTKEEISNTQEVYYRNPNDEHISDTKRQSSVCIARQVVLRPNAQHQVLVTTTSSGLITMEAYYLRSSRQHILAARGILGVLVDQSFYTLVINFSKKHVLLSKHMQKANASDPQDVTRTIRGAIAKNPKPEDPSIIKNQIQLR